MNCIQCRRALAISTDANGFTASCANCGIEHLSLGRLMKLSDSHLTHRIWDLIHSEKLHAEWKRAGECPRCGKSTIGVPFRHQGEDHAVIACSDCYTVAMKAPTLSVFRESNADFQAKRLAEARIAANVKLHAELNRDVENAKRLIRFGVDRAEYLLNDTPLREIRVTALASVAAVILGLFTTIMPFTALEAFGSASSLAGFSAFTHVTFFQLAWNLLFFIPLGAATEREMGGLRFGATFAAIFLIANGLGRFVSPFPDAAQIGLSPVVAALIGRNLVHRIPWGFRGIRFDIRLVATVFFLSELRTMIPTSGGMRWFTLGACVIAATLSAAAAEWEKRRYGATNRSQPSEIPQRRNSLTKSDSPFRVARAKKSA